jgi:hypothetical protein
MSTLELFETLARATWRTIRSAHRHHVQFGEDAITSYNLNALAGSGARNIGFEDDRATESHTGCDFELWLGSDRTGWRRYAVQAKKIQCGTGRYTRLAHVSGETPQIDVLDRYAQANNAIPLYCFYNYSHSRLALRRGRGVEQLGCSVTPSHVVRMALATRGARCFDYLHRQPETQPWRVLISEPGLYDTARQEHGFLAQTAIHPALPAALSRRRTATGPTFREDDDYCSAETCLFPRFVGAIQVEA